MNAQRLIPFSVQDITMSPEQVSAALNKSCNTRLYRYRVTGLCQLREQVHFVLSPTPKDGPEETYLMAPIVDVSPDGFAAEAFERWTSGFNLLGTVELARSFMALYAIPESLKA